MGLQKLSRFAAVAIAMGFTFLSMPTMVRAKSPKAPGIFHRAAVRAMVGFKRLPISKSIVKRLAATRMPLSTKKFIISEIARVHHSRKAVGHRGERIQSWNIVDREIAVDTVKGRGESRRGERLYFFRNNRGDVHVGSSKLRGLFESGTGSIPSATYRVNIFGKPLQAKR